MINDYSELVVEASRLSGITDVAQRAPMYIGMAEDFLSKKLRKNINPLTASNATNQLLAEEPELYLHAVVFQALANNNETERAAVERNYLETLIEEWERAEVARRFTDQKVKLPASHLV